MQISAVVITKNEEKNLRRCLDTLLEVAAEIIVVDDFSTDQTPGICKEYGERVIYNERKFDHFIAQKNHGNSLATHEWILSLDADEMLDDTLIQSIQSIREATAEAYFFKRKNLYAGKWIRYGGWYPDLQMRLWKKTAGTWGGSIPHEKVQLSASVKPVILAGHLVHYAYDHPQQHLAKAKKYGAMKNAFLQQKGKPTGFFPGITHTIAKFMKVFLLKTSFMDGYTGFQIARIAALESWIAYSGKQVVS